MSRRSRKPSLRDLAEEIVRRASSEKGYCSYVVRLSDPPAATEQLQLVACGLLGRPVAIMPAKALTVDEWVQSCSKSQLGRSTPQTADDSSQLAARSARMGFEKVIDQTHRNTVAQEGRKHQYRWRNPKTEPDCKDAAIDEGKKSKAHR